jgi:hypothetical protein
MANPVIKAGNIAIVWSTANGAAGSANALPTGAVIETISVTPKNAEPLDINGSDGFSAILVGLDDGFNARVTFVYDANRPLPAFGDPVTLVVPRRDGNNGTANINCIAWGHSFNRSRNDVAKVELNITYRPHVT